MKYCSRILELNVGPFSYCRHSFPIIMINFYIGYNWLIVII